MKADLFLIIVGQDSNLGDAMHRRSLLDNFFPENNYCRNIYVGRSPSDFLRASGVLGSDVVFRSLFYFLFCALSPFRRKKVFLFNSGEMSITARRLLIETLLFCFLRVFKFQGGKVCRVGIALRDVPLRFRWLWKKCIGLADLVVWRNEESFEFLGRDLVVPDLAFFLKPRPPARSARKRSKIGLSFRFDRELPPAIFFDYLKRYAAARNYRVTAYSQVRMDNDLMNSVAEVHGFEFLPFEPSRPMFEHEAEVEDFLDQCDIVISDRFHALVKAIIHYSKHCCFSNPPNRKVGGHLYFNRGNTFSFLLGDVTYEEFSARLDALEGFSAEDYAYLRSEERRLAERLRLELG